MRRLHHFPLSPFCRKVRLVLGEKKIAFESIAERPWEQQAELSAWPRFVESDGDSLTDARAIAEYLEEKYREPALLPQEVRARAAIRALVNHFDEKLFAQVTAVILRERVLKRFDKVSNRDPDLSSLRTSFDALRDHLAFIGSRADANGCLAGSLSLADLTAAAHLSCIDYFGDVPWQSYPSAREWYARIKSRPSFRPLLSDNLPGFTPVPHYADLDF